jgi:hypothetical protein
VAYELHVKAGVTGQQQLEQLGRTTELQEQKTRRLNDAIQANVQGNTRLTESQKTLTEAHERHIKNLERIAVISAAVAETPKVIAVAFTGATAAVVAHATAMDRIVGLYREVRLSLAAGTSIATASAYETLEAKSRALMENLNTLHAELGLIHTCKIALLNAIEAKRLANTSEVTN